MKRFGFLISLFLSFTAKADILFLDLNNSAQEVESAKRAARARGENVIVIPSSQSPVRQSAGGKKINMDSIKAELRQYDQQGAKISSVVVSGHDGNGQFTGEFGTVSSDILEDAFATVPNMMQNVRSVLLWGCYTTTLGSLEGHWKSVFPNVAVFAGFDGRAPNNTRPANFSYLEGFLKQDRRLAAETDRRKLLDVAKQIDGFNITQSAIWLVMRS